ncbi:MAG: C1 family peptidase [Lentisphaerota bacterium]
MAEEQNYQITDLPEEASNRLYCSEVENQKNLGSCTANAWVGLMEYNQCLAGFGGKKYKDFSRLFLYYEERNLEGTIDEDSGAYLRDGAKALAKCGVCYEKTWPYIINKFTDKPTEASYDEAYPHHIHSYYSLDGRTPEKTLMNLKTCIANKQCFVFGFMVYDYFESDEMKSTGILKMPTANEQICGGHAVMGVGYSNITKTFLIKNSWGKRWGLKGNLGGYFHMPFEYITNRNLASDFWTLVKEY